MKRGRVPWGRELRIRALIGVLAIRLDPDLGAFRGHGLTHGRPGGAALGLALSALGLGFTISARVHHRA